MLNACRLLHDILKDLNTSLNMMKSFSAYKEYLLEKAALLIHGSFEELHKDSCSYGCTAWQQGQWWCGG